MNPVPQITIKGKKYTTSKPKIKLWRHMIKFNEARQNGELNEEEALDRMIDLVVIAFNNPDVTKDSVEENVGLDDLADLFMYINRQVTGLANSKAAQVPNGVAPART